MIARVHDSIYELNADSGLPFTDKQLHYIVIGLFGLILFLVALPLFRALARRGHTGLLAWLFTMAAVAAVSFAIEIGQQQTGTGNMDLEDIVYGLEGFLAVSALIALLYLAGCLLRWLFGKEK